MGYNTTVVILNDGIHAIENDKDFGKKLARAISAAVSGEKQTLYSGSGNVGEVVETHHADYDVTIKVGGNCGRVASLR